MSRGMGCCLVGHGPLGEFDLRLWAKHVSVSIDHGEVCARCSREGKPVGVA